MGRAKHYVPFLGDFKHLQSEYISKGKFVAQYFRDISLIENSKPAYYLQFPNLNLLLIKDGEWLLELNRIIPKYVDRYSIDDEGFGQIGVLGGIGRIKSTEEWKRRRETMMKTIGINHASRFIPLFLKCLTNNFGLLEEGEKINFSNISNTTVFSFILAILFGKNTEQELGMCNYEHKDGRMERMKLQKTMMTLGSNLMAESLQLYNILFPQLIHWNLGKENRRNLRNNNELVRVLKEFLAQSTDATSVYQQVLAELKIDPEEVFAIIMGFLTGGHETTYKAWSSAIYCLKKYPNCLKLLMEDIQESLNEESQFKAEDFLKIFDPQKLDEMDYLSMFLKEVVVNFINSST